MQVKKIFLASSEELKSDRQAFEVMLGRLNQQWRSRETSFDLVIWENFIDAMSRDGLQKEYNRAVKDCDIFVMMFFTKVGPYTLEEFETAFAGLAGGSGPLIYTYFRNDFILAGDIDDGIRTLLDFKARLKALGHYFTTYRNTEDLQYQFSRQLEKLYGDDAASARIDERTPPFKAGEAALTLGYRQLYGDSALADADLERLGRAVGLATRQVRDALFAMAAQMRRETWAGDKRLMERTIPVFEALVRADPNWHAPYGQLGYALVDKLAPDWARAKEALDRAVELRGDTVHEGRYYHYNRARCAVALDPDFAAGRASATAARAAVLAQVKAARRELDDDWERVIVQPDSASIRAWLQRNGSPRLS
jgi:hypothetical protein